MRYILHLAQECQYDPRGKERPGEVTGMERRIPGEEGHWPWNWTAQPQVLASPHGCPGGRGQIMSSLGTSLSSSVAQEGVK